MRFVDLQLTLWKVLINTYQNTSVFPCFFSVFSSNIIIYFKDIDFFLLKCVNFFKEMINLDIVIFGLHLHVNNEKNNKQNKISKKHSSSALIIMMKLLSFWGFCLFSVCLKHIYLYINLLEAYIYICLDIYLIVLRYISNSSKLGLGVKNKN